MKNPYDGRYKSISVDSQFNVVSGSYLDLIYVCAETIAVRDALKNMVDGDEEIQSEIDLLDKSIKKLKRLADTQKDLHKKTRLLRAAREVIYIKGKEKRTISGCLFIDNSDDTYISVIKYGDYGFLKNIKINFERVISIN